MDHSHGRPTAIKVTSNRLCRAFDTVRSQINRTTGLRIGQRLVAQNASNDGDYAKQGLQNGKVLIICGTKDVLIVEKELEPDAKQVLGAENVRFESCNAGHELPVTKSDEIVKYICDFWQL